MGREKSALSKTGDQTFAQYTKKIRVVWNYWPNNNITGHDYWQQPWFYGSVLLAHPVETSHELIKREPPTFYEKGDQRSI